MGFKAIDHLSKLPLKTYIDFLVEFIRKPDVFGAVALIVPRQNKVDTFPPRTKRWFGAGCGCLIPGVEA